MNTLVRRAARVTCRQLLASLLRRGRLAPAPAPSTVDAIGADRGAWVARPLVASHGRLQTAILNHLFWKVQAAKTHAEDPSSVVADAFELAWSAYDCDFERQPTESQLRSVRRAVLRLRQEGHLTRQSHGKYTLTDRAVDGMVYAKIACCPAYPDEPAGPSSASSHRTYPRVGGFSTGLGLSIVG